MDMLTAKIEAASLPADVEQKLLAFMGRLGLVYGAIDMRRTPDGRHVFWRSIQPDNGCSSRTALASPSAMRCAR